MKFIKMMTMLMGIFFLVSCGANAKEDKTIASKEKEVQTAATTKENSKILIAYFSRAGENYSVGTVKVGNTELIANHIKNYLGNRADVFKIEPVQEYPQNYEETVKIATREKNNNERPAFKGDIDISGYDVIFIGYPIWWADAPMIIETFWEKYDFSGKTVIPFNTHQGSGNSGTYDHIKNKLKNANVNTNGLAVSGTDSRQEKAKGTVESWLKGLGY